jgi:hypothetical protein
VNKELTMCKRSPLVLALGVCAIAACGTVAAQSTQTKQYAVTTDRAVTITREVLQSSGFAVVDVKQERDGDRVVLYRPTAGGGRLERMVIRRVENRIVFVDAPEDFLASVDEKLTFR